MFSLIEYSRERRHLHECWKSFYNITNWKRQSDHCWTLRRFNSSWKTDGEFFPEPEQYCFFWKSKFFVLPKAGTELQNQTITDLVGTGEFYITVPRTEIEKVNVKIEITQTSTKKTLFLKGTETTDAIKLDAEQPIVEVARTTTTIPTEYEAKPDEFDLALRKYITQLNGKDLTNTRVPNINLSTLQTGTTSEYKHRKDPVVVQDKDEVTYKIAIYNEGNKAGYATKIVDQLPTGLINSPNNSATVTSKDKSGND